MKVFIHYEEPAAESLRQTLKDRIAQAEIGDLRGLVDLYTQYLQDRDKRNLKMNDEEPLSSNPSVVKTRRLVSAVHTDCVARGRQELRPQERMPLTESTRQHVLDLTALEAPPCEMAKLQEMLQEIQVDVRRAKLPGRRSIRAKVFGPSFKAGSAPGPSSIRNSHIKASLACDQGMEGLLGWCEIEVHDKWLTDDHHMWHGALLVAADCGSKPPASSGADCALACSGAAIGVCDAGNYYQEHSCVCASPLGHWAPASTHLESSNAQWRA